MDQTPHLSPDEIVAYNEAFAKSLAAMNETFHNQQLQSLQIAITAMETLVKLCNTEPKLAKEIAMEQIQQAVDSIKNNTIAASAPVPAPVPAPDSLDWYSALLRALSIAQENAVTAQNNSFMIAESIVTQSVVTLESVLSYNMGYTPNAQR